LVRSTIKGLGNIGLELRKSATLLSIPTIAGRSYSASLPSWKTGLSETADQHYIVTLISADQGNLPAFMRPCKVEDFFWADVCQVSCISARERWHTHSFNG